LFDTQNGNNRKKRGGGGRLRGALLVAKAVKIKHLKTEKRREREGEDHSSVLLSRIGFG